MRRYVAKQRWRLLLQSIHIIQRSKSHFISVRPIPRFRPNWDPTGSSAERILQDRIQTHQENKGELFPLPHVRRFSRSAPVWERFWDASLHHSLDEDLVGQFGGSDLHTSVASSQGSLPQLHSLDEDIREDFKNSDLLTSFAAWQDRLPQLHSFDKDIQVELEDYDSDVSLSLSSQSSPPHVKSNNQNKVLIHGRAIGISF
jgi:hypothetical protein